jgi:hypothetical protein
LIHLGTHLMKPVAHLRHERPRSEKPRRLELQTGSDFSERRVSALADAHPELRMPGRAHPSPGDACLGEVIAEREATIASEVAPDR